MVKLKITFIFLCIWLINGINEAGAENIERITSETILSQSWNFPTLLTPAATGEVESVRFVAGSRLEYLGNSGSPKFYYGAFDMPLQFLNKRIGGGVTVNVNTGEIFKNTNLAAQFSYGIKISNYQLRIGLQAGYFRTKFKISNFNNGAENEALQTNETDPTHPEPTYSNISAGNFDLGVGVKLENPNFYVGISGLHLTQPVFYQQENLNNSAQENPFKIQLLANFYFDIGGNIPLKNTLLSLQPSLILGTDFHNFTGIAEIRGTWKKKVTFGLDYRWKEALGIFAGLFLKKFYIGYSWEYDFNKAAKGSIGNHEIAVGYQFELNKSIRRPYIHKSIRLM